MDSACLLKFDYCALISELYYAEGFNLAKVKN